MFARYRLTIFAAVGFAAFSMRDAYRLLGTKYAVATAVMALAVVYAAWLETHHDH